MITRDLQLALAIYTIGVERSRRAYHEHMASAERVQPPQALRKCPICERTHIGPSPKCGACRQRAYRERRKADAQALRP